MSGHTPGPWRVGYRAMDVVSDNVKICGDAKICDIRGWGYLTGNGHGALGLPPEEAVRIQDANARLIAAAPEMLEALKAAMPYVARYESAHASNEALDVLGMIDAAIAKAEGRS